MRKYKLIVILCVYFFGLNAQDTLQELPFKKRERPPFDRKEEIIYDGKRYRIHNTYLTVGGGFLQSTIRSKLQKNLGLDFHFPIRNHHFQVGVFMSGEEFASNNNIQGHICYGIRREKNKSNFAAYVGPSYATGVEGNVNSGNPKFYDAFGAYISIQAVMKFTYDIGFGAELFSELGKKQNIIGLKLIAFFSGSYRGPKRNYNPNVRAENPL
ncbi:hypothetical protein [Aurantibacillus circumpalustris]|uniref:hypothetical protein n=1 Tax=Aurantibacillus circumpalustris TaxID=3036359 RepID=UPI00295BD282|nr:hypothetical protein [Aurantibacillus circumpalustris]